jgi:membrane protease YdiL (CAAX protease family)
MSVFPMEPSPPPPPSLPDEPADRPPGPGFDDGGWAPPSAAPPPWPAAAAPPNLAAYPPSPAAYPANPVGAPPSPVGAPVGAYGWTPAPVAEPTRSAWMGFTDEQPRWGMPDILLGLLCWLLAQILIVLPVAAVTKDETVISIAGLIGGWVGMVGYLVLISRRKGLKSLRRDFGFDFKAIDPLLGFGLGIVTIIVSGIVRVIVAQLFSEPAGSNAERIFGGAENNHALLLVLAMMAGIGAPIVEELFFRGLALRSIDRRFGTVAGIIGSSLVFSVLHWQPGSFGSTVSLVSGILIYGLVFGTAARYFRRLGPSTFAHMTINTLASAFLLYTVFSGNPIVP